jgi:hypothetical protein
MVGLFVNAIAALFYIMAPLPLAIASRLGDSYGDSQYAPHSS